MIRVEPPVETWQVLAEFPKYEISMQGAVRNIDSGIRISPAKFNGVDYVELMHEGKPYLQHVNRLRWVTFPLAGLPYPHTDLSRHGAWNKTKARYADGESAHPCGFNCSVGEV